MICEKGDEMENFNNEPTLFDSVGKGISVVKENSITETGETAQSALKCFENVKFGKVRVLGDSENPLFCLADICKILGLESTNKVANSIKREFGWGELNSAHLIDELGRKQKATFISEPQLYFVLMRSDKPNAKPFRQWVTREVLPQIRKTGTYSVSQTHAIPKTYAEALLEAGWLALENERLLAQAQKNAPLVKFAENVAHSVNSISVNEFAKILGIKDFGEKKLFAWLRENAFLNAFNQPYQKYVNLGLFELKEGTYATQKGLNTYTQTLITGKGQIYLSEKIENFLKGGEND